MKKAWLFIGLVVVSLMAGCTAVKTYTDEGRAIDVGVGRDFVIALGSNPSTGYGWQEAYDASALELVSQTYKPAQKDVIGSGGVEYLRFRALKAGSTEVTLSYQRPWETEAISRKVFTVTVRD